MKSSGVNDSHCAAGNDAMTCNCEHMELQCRSIVDSISSLKPRGVQRNHSPDIVTGRSPARRSSEANNSLILVSCKDSTCYIEH